MGAKGGAGGGTSSCDLREGKRTAGPRDGGRQPTAAPERLPVNAVAARFSSSEYESVYVARGAPKSRT
jgi:hypothetical protein